MTERLLSQYGYVQHGSIRQHKHINVSDTRVFGRYMKKRVPFLLSRCHPDVAKLRTLVLGRKLMEGRGYLSRHGRRGPGTPLGPPTSLSATRPVAKA